MPVDKKQLLDNARSLAAAGQHDDARRCLLEVLQQEPDDRAALIMLGGAYFAMQKYSEAEMVFERLILMDPGRGEFSIALFNCLLKMQRTEEALEEIRRFMQHADTVAEKTTIRQYIEIIENNFS